MQVYLSSYCKYFAVSSLLLQGNQFYMIVHIYALLKY